MRVTSFVCLVLFGCVFVNDVAEAAPRFLVPTQAYEVLHLEGDPQVEQEYYGTLTGDPHMYELVAQDPLILTFTLDEKVNDALPSLPLSYIVVEALSSGRVREIARLPADNNERTSLTDRMLGMNFTRVPVYRAELPAGTYRIEVSALDNSGSYRLTVGDILEQQGYFGAWQRVLSVNNFFGTSLLGLLSSVFIQIHILLIFVGLLVWRFGYPWYKRRFPHA